MLIQGIMGRANSKKHTNTDNYTHVTVQTKENADGTKDEHRLSLNTFAALPFPDHKSVQLPFLPAKDQVHLPPSEEQRGKEKEERKEGNRKVGMESKLNSSEQDLGPSADGELARGSGALRACVFVFLFGHRSSKAELHPKPW